MRKVLACSLIVMVLLTGCSSEAPVVRMSFQGIDTGRNADIGTYGSAAMADFITSEISAISIEDAKMEDEQLSAGAELKIDITNNQLIFANNVYDRIYPASTTKILTALMLLKYGNLTDTYTFREDDGGVTVFGAKLCGFKKGDTVTLETLLNCLLVYSGNDAGVGIAEYLYGSEEAFVAKMNEEALKLGATHTNFENSHGLHNKNHYTTAYDMYLIFRECIQYDSFVKSIHQREYTAVYKNAAGESKQKSFETTNMFLLGTMKVPEGVTVVGGKTGSTGDAGDCLILLSETEEGNQFITGVFKASSRDSLYTQLAYLLEMK